MNLIAIVREHLWLIAALNGGVVPEIEEEVTFFVVDENDMPHILTADEARVQVPDSDEYVTRFTA